MSLVLGMMLFVGSIAVALVTTCVVVAQVGTWMADKQFPQLAPTPPRPRLLTNNRGEEICAHCGAGEAQRVRENPSGLLLPCPTCYACVCEGCLGETPCPPRLRCKPYVYYL